MKIELDIDKKYDETSVVIKSKKLTEEVLEVLEKLKNEKSQKFLGKKNDKIYFLNPSDIICFYSNEQKILADTDEGSFEVKMKLYEIEEKLENMSFVRCSKFAIVNIEKINNIELSFGGSLIINLVNGKRESISRRYVKKVKEYLGMEGK